MDSAKFLADQNDIRHYLTVPMFIDGYEVCTNGIVIIFTPVPNGETRVPDGTPEYTLKRIRVLLGEIKGATDWREPPEIVYPEKVACAECGGIGKAISIPCPDCRGEGVHYFHEGNHEYECECQECDGDGKIVSGDQNDGDTCYACGGDGMVFDHKDPLHFYGLWINPYYYQLIDNEPGLMLCSKPDASVLYFRAGEQFGVIMGRMEPNIMNKEAA